MPYNSKAFGIVIARLRVQKGLSQETASGLAGIARSHLVMLENGKKTVRLDTLWRIAEALDIRPGELVRLVEQEAEQRAETEERRRVEAAANKAANEKSGG